MTTGGIVVWCFFNRCHRLAKCIAPAAVQSEGTTYIDLAGSRGVGGVSAVPDADAMDDSDEADARISGTYSARLA